MSAGKGSVAFLSWGAAGGRARDIVRELGAEPEAAWAFRPARLERGRLTPLRWLVQAGATVVHLARTRPSALVATNPPIWLGLIAWAYARLRGVPLVLDSHPGGFGGHEDAVAARLQRLHAWLCRRVGAVLVTADSWGEQVRRWGGTAIVLWEAPVAWTVAAARDRSAADELRVLYIGVFGADEPSAVFIDAMRSAPGVRASVTGDVRKAPAGLVAGAPANVTFVGYLGADEYVAAIADADVVVTMTTEPTSVMRSGCEAVWARRPLVVSDSPATRVAFPHATHVTNDAGAVAAALGALRAAGPPDEVMLHAAHAFQERAWATQVAQLRGALRLG